MLNRDQMQQTRNWLEAELTKMECNGAYKGRQAALKQQGVSMVVFHKSDVCSGPSVQKMAASFYTIIYSCARKPKDFQPNIIFFK